MIFRDGVSRIKSLIMFRGKGTKLLKTERVYGISDAWVDEIMLRWLQNQWQLAIDFDGYSG